MIRPAWKVLIRAAGSNGDVCDAVGISPATLYSVSRGQSAFPKDRLDALQIYCDLLEVPNPVEKEPPPRQTDLVPLRLLGDAVKRGFPIDNAELTRLRAKYPEYQLIELAEGKGTPELILLGVTKLLE